MVIRNAIVNKRDQPSLKRLNEAVLRPGDIILTTQDAAISKAVRVVTKSDISHAMLYVEDRSVIDATGEGAHARNTQRLYFVGDCTIHAMRLRQELSSEQLKTVIAYMRGRIGTECTKKVAAMAVLGGKRTWSAKQFCSHLVAQAFCYRRRHTC